MQYFLCVVSLPFENDEDAEEITISLDSQDDLKLFESRENGYLCQYYPASKRYFRVKSITDLVDNAAYVIRNPSHYHTGSEKQRNKVDDTVLEREATLALQHPRMRTYIMMSRQNEMTAKTNANTMEWLFTMGVRLLQTRRSM